MDKINDSLFALIVRFVGIQKKVSPDDPEFMRQELKAIKSYIAQYSPEEQDDRAMDWVQKHAWGYRKAWEKTVLERRYSDFRCPDCPLAGVNPEGHCEIHDRWMELLEEYVADEIDSKEYVLNALRLLSSHKEELKVKLGQMKV